MSVNESEERITRILAAAQATHDAFTEAAGVVIAPGLGAEFVRRAEYLGRVIINLRGQQAPAGLASDALWNRPDVRSGRTTVSGDGNHRQLYDQCLRLMDVATMEFCRGYGPNVAQALSSAMRTAHPINTTRHEAEMSGWPDAVDAEVPTVSTPQRARVAPRAPLHRDRERVTS